ncbi:MAG: nitrilase-related carbon-nitrogen hydrolase [Verrucomicrobiae bacterium]|nr:nitrilase-related carbon-nitrogen hydrolase [Verrucomicrobiae bacterium]
MRLGLLQLDIAWENPPANLERIRSLVGGQPALDLLVLPEMFATGFSFNRTLTAGTADLTHQLARELHCYVLGGGVSADAQFNQAVLADPTGRELLRYTKQFPFRPGNEPYRSGAGPVIIEFAGIQLSPLICYDLRFPEAFGPPVAELYIVIANWPAERALHWNALLRARAIENQACVVGVNRCGRDPHHEYIGESQVIGPTGDLMAHAGRMEQLVTVEIQPEIIREYRRQFPTLADARRLRAAS